MMAQDRVRVVERWIQVAQECKILKNFSSPCTVISVLQKTSICHLKNTWRKFPGGAFHVCPPEINPQRVQEKEQQQQQLQPVLPAGSPDLVGQQNIQGQEEPAIIKFRAPRTQYRAPYQWTITASSSAAGTQLGSLRCTGPAPPT
ncbi:ral guanine nucleotide dissociation stimulator-like isoform X3 [Diceros bicornis minor]|uniref:ral guanine nucleotide dissociation stimulator-like isoform X3 n=1 Tax=Diceros bicornis minor TaxID=77932 RepID=UPI0026EE6D9A|nr:ral guanine nucleotide dissociation stimulator-like isoform X3 [Diceros bicornis minor]XP_058393075.1 ral guanine nucleotide dissociation stimulator-like isoform X3 [Diceros bicornis minor]XP_058393076.1 ral guanine nucleotide dissociation stimulator-like isoform X3 [Diceros bicornis minor]XP_058393077.1 ral guanine nucleotide dissociation stimulator-like isoform X3 [Diceros bicornis minor]XP_058393078.1 ral guanine nucleotide dissociation stimulator-like isoform X3 [Diceros bicornis minor]